MWDNSGQKNTALPAWNLPAGWMSCTDATAGPPLSVLGAWSPQRERTNSVTRQRARQSSRLYVSSCCLTASSLLFSQAILHATLWMPEVLGEDHLAPRKEPMSFSPLE